MSTQLPLFPLRIVLFPGALLPLHIFEPRYRRLLDDLTGDDPSTFGLLPAGTLNEWPDPGTVGCEARVRGVQPLPDGRANIVVSGERRFELLRTVPAPTLYYQGMVDWLPDLPEVQVPSGAEVRLLHSLGERYARARHALLDRTLDIDLPRDPGPLSFAIAAFLEWEFEALQRFLEIRSVHERVTRLLATLPALVATEEARALAHARARQNGHGAIA